MEKPQQETKAIVRLDKSRDYATVHGDRRPGDPHHEVHFYQFGLPFNAHGELIADHPEIGADPRKQAAVEKLMKRAVKVKQEAPGDEVDKLLGNGGGDDDDDDTPVLNLEMWARGEQKWPWQQVSDAIAARFAKRVTDKKGAVEVLIEERVVNAGQLSNELRKLVA
jgi:hypothetical protein